VNLTTNIPFLGRRGMEYTKANNAAEGVGPRNMFILGHAALCKLRRIGCTAAFGVQGLRRP